VKVLAALGRVARRFSAERPADHGGQEAEGSPRPERQHQPPPFQNLPPIADLARGQGFVVLDESWLERSLADYIREDTWALPSPADREGYAPGRDYDYWLSGLKDYLAVKRLLRRHGVSLDAGTRILDFGCASGRVLRHFDAHEKGHALWACDVNPRHVSWVSSFLGPSIRVFPNAASPSLPVEDDHFALVYAFSVFTHIDEWELGWLAEVRRVLKPGGLAYLTILSDRTWRSQKPGCDLYDQLFRKSLVGGPPITPELFAREMPAGKVVFALENARAGEATLFHSLQHVRDVWGRFFEVVEVVPEGHDYQDVVLLRK